MRILLIRHAEPDYSIDSLTPKGFVEAEILSTRVAAIRPDHVFVSPLGRAKDTAKPALDKLHIQAEVLPWLQEYPARIKSPSGEGTVLPWDFMPSDWTCDPMLYDKEQWLNAERMKTGDVMERYRDVTMGVDSLLARYGFMREGGYYTNDDTPQVTIALFCHFAVSMVILSHLLGISPVPLWQGMFMPPSSITTVCAQERERGKLDFRCLGVGDVSHLYAADEPVSLSGFFYEGRPRLDVF